MMQGSCVRLEVRGTARAHQADRVGQIRQRQLHVPLAGAQLLHHILRLQRGRACKGGVHASSGPAPRPTAARAPPPRQDTCLECCPVALGELRREVLLQQVQPAGRKRVACLGVGAGGGERHNERRPAQQRARAAARAHA